MAGTTAVESDAGDAGVASTGGATTLACATNHFLYSASEQ